MKAYKETIRKYYKYQYEDWTQPVLSTNGFVGGNNFAVIASAEYSSDYAAWKSFDNSSSTFWIPLKSGNNPAGSYIIMYNPNELNITSIVIKNRNQASCTINSGIVYGSNDWINWDEVKTFTNNVTTANGTWTIDLSANTDYYKYYKIYVVSGGYNVSYGFGLSEIQAVATQRITIEGTTSDYDFYKDVDVYKLPKINETYYGIGG